MAFTVVIRPYLEEYANSFEIVHEQCYRCERQRVASVQELNDDRWTMQERIVDDDELPSVVICGECYDHGYTAQCAYYNLRHQNFEAAFIEDFRTRQYETGNLTVLPKPQRKRDDFAKLES